MTWPALAFHAPDGEHVLQCPLCLHFSATERGTWVCRHCAGTVANFVAQQATRQRARSTGMRAWRTWRRQA